MKRFTFIFALLLATTTMMAEEFTLGKLKFETLSDTEVELVGADKGITNIYLNSPITYQGKSYSVTIIRDWAFEACYGLTSVTIGNSVKSIGDWAFYECTGLTSVTIANSVTSIGGGAFEGTAFYNNQSNWDNGALYLGDCLIRLADGYVGDYDIKENTRLIASAAFLGCTSLTSITIPNSVTNIEDYVFDGCTGLTSVTIPNSVTSIGWAAFSGCSGLTSITIPNSVTSIGGGAFVGTAFYNNPSNWDKGALYIDNCLIAVDDNIAGNHNIKENTRLIADAAFYACEKLTSVTIPNSVTSIGGGAFSSCYSLTSITIPNSVTIIGEGAFDDCYSLTSITIPHSVTSIGKAAFGGCESLTSIVVEQGNVKYDSRDNCNAIIETTSNTLISGCQNTIIPNSVTSIGNYAFGHCENLTSIIIPSSVTSIAEAAFSGCTGLTSITIPNSVTSIGDAAFYNCSSLTSVTVPSHTKIGKDAFPDHTEIIRK